MGAPATPSASVVIPTCDKGRYLDLTLASYLQQTGASFELVVVDDGSRDHTSKVIEKYRRDLPIQHVQQENRGRSAARNSALRVASGDIVVFSDDDRIVPPTFLTDHLERHHDLDEDLLLLGGQRGVHTWLTPELNADDRLGTLLTNHPELRNHRERGDEVQLVSVEDVAGRFAEVVATYACDEPWWTDFCVPVLERVPEISSYALAWTLGTTGNMSAHRDLVKEVGPFDERFNRWGLEDAELSYRLVQAGAVVQVSQSAINYHQVHPVSPERLHQWCDNYVHFARKHDTMDVLVALLLVDRRIDVVRAHNVLKECERLVREGRPTVVEELTQRYRELVAALLPGKYGGQLLAAHEAGGAGAPHWLGGDGISPGAWTMQKGTRP